MLGRKFQRGAALTEYLPLIGVALSLALGAFQLFGGQMRDQGATISQELGGQPARSVNYQAPSTSLPDNGTFLGSKLKSDFSDSGSGSSSGSNSGGISLPDVPGTGTPDIGVPGNDLVDPDQGTGGDTSGDTNGNTNGNGTSSPGDQDGNGNDEDTLLQDVIDLAKGIWDGLIQQGEDLLQLIFNPIESAEQIYELAKAMIYDPVETTKLLLEELKGEAEKLLYGSAYEKGQVIGENLNPVVLFKVVKTLKNTAKVNAALKKDQDNAPEITCSIASFAAGTKIFTERGDINIEDIAVGTIVSTRSEVDFTKQWNPVTKLLNREVTHYYKIKVGRETVLTTEEHPFWLQGKGWTQAKDLKVGDLVVNFSSDAHVLVHERIDEPLKVYNLSVANNHNYFANGIWVHNANGDCQKDQADKIANYNGPMPPPSKKPDQAMREMNQKHGVDFEMIIDEDLINNPNLLNVYKNVDTDRADLIRNGTLAKPRQRRSVSQGNPKNISHVETIPDKGEDLPNPCKALTIRENCTVYVELGNKTGQFEGTKIYYDQEGYPDFTELLYVGDEAKTNTVRIALTGDTKKDFAKANKLAGINDKFLSDNNLTWHHHQDLGVMQLINNQGHAGVSHSGGQSIYKQLSNNDNYNFEKSSDYQLEEIGED
ncbi:polymorphic toxin-type HINT domain-containing protein [Motilimonas cestriensis]|uniref:polymorphic toxin-type HINT domain-containing protein n=1 Tax=Motilimonas cestriensis TaxID=2742685 RepID=UPI003DA46F97